MKFSGACTPCHVIENARSVRFCALLSFAVQQHPFRSLETQHLHLYSTEHTRRFSSWLTSSSPAVVGDKWTQHRPYTAHSRQKASPTSFSSSAGSREDRNGATDPLHDNRPKQPHRPQDSFAFEHPLPGGIHDGRTVSSVVALLLPWGHLRMAQNAGQWRNLNADGREHTEAAVNIYANIRVV